MKKKILAVVAHERYESVEFKVPKEIVEKAGFTVEVASDKPGTATAEKEKGSTPVDKTLENVNVADYEAIYFVGGPGALERLDNEKSYNIMRAAADAGVSLGAICIATRILAKSGVNRDLRATGWNEDKQLEDLYKNLSVHYVPQPVVIDENFVTAIGPSAAKEFGEGLLRVIELHKGWR